jgi:hypothetical protein
MHFPCSATRTVRSRPPALAGIPAAAWVTALLLVGTLVQSGHSAGASQSQGSAPPGSEALPRTVDLRPAFEKLGLERRQQGKRPTCSVFALVGALEFAASQHQQSQQLSAEFLNWAANQVTATPNDGGFFSELWHGFKAYGICAESQMPYRPEFDPAKGPDPETLAAAKARLGLGLQLHWIKRWDVQTGLTDAQFWEIKQTLRRGWPVCAGCRWPKTEQWNDGVLQLCGPEAVRDGHSVLLVGYRDDDAHAGGGVFIFRNSSHGGRDGYMPYGYAREYVNDAVWVEAPTPGAASTTPRPEAVVPSIFRDALGALAAPNVGRNRRVSSNQQPDWNNANMDMTLLPPGQKCEFPLLKGPGMITHIWMTSHAGRVNELNALSLRIYWDERDQPGVEVPLGDFFAVGQGQPAVVESVPVQVSPSGSLSCYWRMPFANSARIVVSNDNPDRTAGLYWQVDYVELDELPPGTPYFHARYRQEYPAVAGRDYLVADLQGRGHYVGTVISVTLGQDGWWGEGDDFFYIDGESVPSLQGTGSEDYFNDAWGFRQRTGPWFGQPRWQGDRAGDSGVGYRWHVLDPVVFTHSLRFTLEHKGNHEEDTEGFYVERPDFISSVAFWYQVGEPKAFATLPPYPERRVPWQQHHLVRAFRQVKASGAVQPQVQFSGMFGARPILAWPNNEVGARLAIPFKVESAGRYAIRLTGAAAPHYGSCQVNLDGQTVLARADFKAPDFEELDLALGTRELAAGPHELVFVALASEDGAARPFAVELLRLLQLPPEARRAVKNHNEAHFIRLGIGRAVYAYRLAYGELPESLETLVSAGLMSKRYLADENHKPLKAKREGDQFIVQSTGVNPWTHRWQGLDARR